MAYLNRLQLIGNVGRDPEERVAANGRTRLSFTLATTRKYKGADGQLQEQTDWHSLVAWGPTAETLKRLEVRKGTPLYVEGPVHYRTWDREDGTKGFSAEVAVDAFQLLGSRQQRQEGGQYREAASFTVGRERSVIDAKKEFEARKAAAYGPTNVTVDDNGDELPF